MNALFEKIITERNGHYCHCLELATAYELECVIEAITAENEEEFGKEVIKDFFNSMQIIYYVDESEGEENESDEAELYAFNSDEFIDNL